MPGWIEICPCPADDANTQRDNWYENEKGYQRAFEEAWKIVCYVNDKTSRIERLLLSHRKRVRNYAV